MIKSSFLLPSVRIMPVAAWMSRVRAWISVVILLISSALLMGLACESFSSGEAVELELVAAWDTQMGF